MKLTGAQKLTAVLVVLALILALTAVIAAFAGTALRAKPLSAGSLAKPQIPRLAFDGYPSEAEENELSEVFARVEASNEKSAEYTQALTPFFESSTREILSAHGDGNMVYSPLNLYMALSMAAEITDGSSRGQILDLLGAPDIETLREQSGDIWLMSSLSMYGSETDLNNSLWLNNHIDYKQETMDTLANDHFAESFRGEPGTEEYNKLLRDWTNEKTHNLLEESAGGLEMSPDMLMTLMSTVYFKGSWQDMFQEEENVTLPFHSPEGDMDCTFMHRTWDNMTYCRGEHFGAVSLGFTGGNSMTFILPDEDSSVDQLLTEGSDLWEFLASRPWEWPDGRGVQLELNMPKFDVSSDNELTDALKSLGITDAFDAGASDFGPLMNNDIPAYISEVNHAARVMVDEEGCTAASYVEIGVSRMSAVQTPTEKLVFTLDRPFIFMIKTQQDMPLFMGVVNRP